MPRTCTVCTHPERSAIEHELITNSSSFRDIARQRSVSKDALARHRAEHLPASLATAHAAVEVARADTLLDEVRSAGDRADRLYGHAEMILERALESKDLKTAVSAISVSVNVMREARGYLELRGEISGELNPAPAGGLSFGPNGRLSILTFPKTPEADAIERERLAKLTDEQKANLVNSLIMGSGPSRGIICSPAIAELVLGPPDGSLLGPEPAEEEMAPLKVSPNDSRTWT